MTLATLRIVPVAAAAVLPLRQQVLRPMQQLAECVYPGDEHPASLHLGASAAGALIGVVSIFPEAGPAGIASPSYRLRGMAVDAAWQGQGVGSLLMEGVIRWLTERDYLGVLWCNARITASAFYTDRGWQIVGEPFELPLIGPHVVMQRTL